MRFRVLTTAVVLAVVAATFACSDSSGPPPALGPLSRLAVQSGDSQRALAGTPLPNPIIIVPQDEEGRTVRDQTATFTVIAGGGSLSSSTGTVNADGTITAPIWTLGKSDVPQELRVQIGTKTLTVTARVQTAYTLEVRFFGAAVKTEHRALFTTAAARIRAIIVGALPAVNVEGADVTPCTGSGSNVAPLTGTVDGLLIFASVDSIDGPGKVLGQAGPCFVRQENSVRDYRTVVGTMKFDSADIAALFGSQSLEQVITHEMLHVVGVGTFWDVKNLIINSGQPGAAYIGPRGIAGCREVGGTVICTSSVPVEDCVGIPESSNCGDGQREGHWKETTFKTELMTPYLSSTNFLSVMTIRSLEDLNYTVNTAAADPYTVPTPSFSSGGASSSALISTGRWELPLDVAPRALPTIGPAPLPAP